MTHVRVHAQKTIRLVAVPSLCNLYFSLSVRFALPRYKFGGVHVCKLPVENGKKEKKKKRG